MAQDQPGLPLPKEPPKPVVEVAVPLPLLQKMTTTPERCWNEASWPW